MSGAHTAQHHRPALARADFGPVTVFFGDKNGKYPDGNQVIVRGADAVAVFDSPISANYIGAAFNDADLCILGHVHEDHMAGLHLLAGKPVHVHEADLAAIQSWDGLAGAFGYEGAEREETRKRFEEEFHYQPTPDAIPYQDGASWDLGGGVTVRAIHLPGHTPGHCALLVDPVGVAFIGDIDLSTFGPYYGDTNGSLSQFRQSLKAVADIPATTWITFHHKGVYTERERFDADLAAYAARLDAREHKLLAMLADGPQSIAQMAKRRLLYPAHVTESWVGGVEARSIAMHLEEMVADGRVKAEEAGLYRLA